MKNKMILKAELSLIIILTIFFSFSCKKKQFEEKITVDVVYMEFINATGFMDQSYSIFKNGESVGIEFCDIPNHTNKFETEVTYTLMGSTGYDAFDTIAEFYFDNQGNYTIIDNVNTTWVDLKYGNTCNGKGFKIWN